MKYKSPPRQDLDLAIKKNHTVTCPFKGDGKVIVTWKKQGLAKLPTRMRLLGNSLLINDLKLSDSGKYSCDVKGKYNSVSTSVEVYVLGMY